MALFTPRIPSCHHHTCSKIDEAQTQNHATRPYKMDGGRRFQLRSSRLYPAEVPLYSEFWFSSKSHQQIKGVEIIATSIRSELGQTFYVGDNNSCNL